MSKRMTNGEKYKTLTEQFQAFRKFCDKSYRKGCRKCLSATVIIGECWKAWLSMEAEEEKGEKVVINANNETN